MAFAEEEEKEEEKSKQAARVEPCRLKLIGFIKKWVGSSGFDINEEAVNALKTFQNEDVLPTLGEKPSSVIGKALEKMLADKKKPPAFSFTTPPPNPIVPSKHADCGFLDIDAIEFARQLTLLDFKVYKDIKPQECLDQNWLKAAKEELAPNVIQVISNFNFLSDLVATSIVLEEDIKKRVATYERWVEIAVAFRELNNFDGVMKIIGGMGKNCVYRLKLTKGKLKKKTQTQLDELQELMKPQKSSSLYRAALHGCSPPAIPYLGLYLTDLVFIEDGNPNYLKDENGEVDKTLINFTKRRQTAKVIQEIRQYQQVPYNLVELPFVTSTIFNFKTLPEDELYEKSLVIEPRQPKNK